MKLPSFRRIITQDFKKEFQELMEQLGSNINDGFNVVYTALNKRLTFTDNIACTVKTITVTVDSSGNPQEFSQFNLDVQNTPVLGVVVISAQNLTNPAVYPSSAVWISYSQDGNRIIINNIKGLQADNVYSLRVIAIN
jgi:hypothetical protein